MYANYQTFEDADRHAHALTGWDQRYDQVGEGAFRSTVKQVSVAGVQVFQESANVRIVQRGQLPAGFVTFGLVLGGGAPFSFQGVRVDENALVVAPGSREFLLHSPPDMSMLGVAVESSLLAAAADAAGVDIQDELFNRHVLSIPGAAGARAGKRIIAAVETVLSDSNPFIGDDGAHRFTQTVTESLLDLLTFHVPTREDRLTYACRADVVRRAHDLVLASPEQPISVLDLCEKLRVSRRTIQNSFQSVAQMNPVSYLRAVRLAQVRRLLTTTSQGEVPVREAAMRWGFANLGHFASDYKSLFGELPSQTQRAR
ncbi:AraC family transcriptional regulator [Burkholderia sp. THE68]|jgi:AraC-like DNA-binding protein|uniref:helix-turn-helix domain-containing protein n=1 Tax=Burkholderiaceae TaxID=119060 RepID=UPI0013164E7D|nr:MULTISPECIES: helix-turn-helix domain-containing protein [Burkholderiaceae]BBU29584.1 AraC family transcriptional regulator [Burkholderia sp. THE68]BCQ25428.1 helix-turn-helix domain-containing protein [Caballeronia sp. NK8]